MTGNSMTEFISEFNDVNQGGIPGKRPKGLIEITLADGETLLVSKVTWQCYFPDGNQNLNLTKKVATLLFKLLHCELSD